MNDEIENIIGFEDCETPIYHYCEHGVGWYGKSKADNCPCAPPCDTEWIEEHPLRPPKTEAEMDFDFNEGVVIHGMWGADEIWKRAKDSYDKQVPGYHFNE